MTLADPGVGAGAPTWSRVDRAQALLDLAEQLQGLLVPVAPAPGFRHRLSADLARKGREATRSEDRPRQGGAVLSKPTARRGMGILLRVAALGSLASLVGVVLAFMLRSRQSRATHTA